MCRKLRVDAGDGRRIVRRVALEEKVREVVQRVELFHVRSDRVSECDVMEREVTCLISNLSRINVSDKSHKGFTRLCRQPSSSSSDRQGRTYTYERRKSDDDGRAGCLCCLVLFFVICVVSGILKGIELSGMQAAFDEVAGEIVICDDAIVNNNKLNSSKL